MNQSDPMKLHQMRYLVAVAAHGSVRAAARALSLTQASVTQGIKELEGSCQVPLFERHSSGIRLNDAGHELLRHAQIIAGELDQAQADLAARRQAATRVRLSIGVTPWLVQALLPQLLASFRSELPEVQLEFYEGLSGLMHPKLRDGSLDLLIGRLPATQLSTDFFALPMFRYETAVMVRRGHPMADTRALADLLSFDWLINYTPQEEAAMLQQLFGQHGLAPPVERIHLAHSASLLLHLVRHSDMITYCPWPLIEAEGVHGHLVTVPLCERFPAHTVGVLHRHHSLPFVAQRFIHHLRLQVLELQATRDPALRRVLRSLEVLI